MKIGVIADDLTGANATGVRLTKQGFEVATMVYYNQPILKDSFNTACIDTDSRYAAKEVAQMRVRKALGNLKDWGADVICKRIDSTIRGNIGEELDVILGELGETSVAVVVASFPESRRITLGGYLLVDGIPVQATDVAKDPVKPLTQSFIPDVIQEQSRYPVSHIGLKTVLDGEQAIAEQMQQHIQDGSRIVVIDAVTNEEIEAIARAMVLIDDHQMVPADPGPLTAAYSRDVTRQSARNRKVIVTVGSVTSNSGKQMHYLVEKTNSRPVYVEARKLASGTDNWNREIERAVERALQEMERQEVIIITTSIPGAEQLDLKVIAEAQGNTQEYLAKRIADGLAKITRVVIERSPYEIGGCFSSGGDVTASLCSVGNAQGIKLLDEVLPLIAFGRFMGGHFDGIPLVTKGGMAGDKDAIYTSVKHLLAQSSL